jgi:hypothetical protein
MGSRYSLNVTAGNHAGARQELTDKAYYIGSSLDADMVLTDSMVLGRHARIFPHKDHVEVEALEEPLRINGSSVGRGISKVAYPANIEIGDAHLRISRAQKISTSRFAMLAGLVVILGLSLNQLLGSPTQQVRTASQRDEASVAMQKRGIEPTLEKDNPKASEAAANELRDRLSKAGLPSLTVRSSSGTVLVSGMIAAGQESDWHAAEVWFDEQFGQKVPLQSDVKVSTDKPVRAPVTIQAVWHGSFPYFIDGDGHKHFEGSVLKDGWILEKVLEDKLVLRRQNQPLIIRLD